MKKTFTAAVLGCFAMSTMVAAPAHAGVDKEKINPWEHCGIGAMVFPKSKDRIFAIISNVIWDLGTTAVSSKISSADSCKGEEVQTAMFIKSHYGSLETEIAMGQGTYLTAMADVMGCSQAARPALFASIRSEHAGNFSSASFAQLDEGKRAESLYYTVRDLTSNEFAGQCTATV